MKRSGIWCALILVALALPLAAGAKAQNPRADRATGSSVTGQNGNQTQAIRIVPPVPNFEVKETPVRGWFDYVLPVLTGLLILVAFVQARLLYWTYITEHRPRLRIRYITLVKPDELLISDTSSGTTVAPMEVVIVLENSGASRAQIKEGNVSLKPVGGHGMKDILRSKPTLPDFDKTAGLPVYSADRNAFVGVKIKPGERAVRRYPVPKSESLQETGRTLLAIEHGEEMKHLAFYVFGFLRYVDWTKRSYVVAFCRRYDKQADDFVPVRDRRYEYSD